MSWFLLISVAERRAAARARTVVPAGVRGDLRISDACRGQEIIRGSHRTSVSATIPPMSPLPVAAKPAEVAPRRRVRMSVMPRLGLRGCACVLPMGR